MYVIRPTPVTPAMLTQSNAAGSDEPEYNPAISYALGQRVVVPADGYTYECVQAPALGKDPQSNPLHWMRTEPSNRWAMWDSEISTATRHQGDLQATLTVPGRFNAVGVFGLEGQSISLVQKSASDEVLFTQTFALRSNPNGWYSYYFEPRTQLREVVAMGFVPSSGSRLEITIEGASGGWSECAYVLVGNVLELGDAQYGATSGIVSYSKKETSSTGVQTLKKGRRSKRMSVLLLQERGQFSAISRALDGLDATPAVWVGAPCVGDYEPLTILGFYRDFQIEVAGPTHNTCSLDIEGLI